MKKILQFCYKNFVIFLSLILVFGVSFMYLIGNGHYLLGTLAFFLAMCSGWIVAIGFFMLMERMGVITYINE